MPRRLPGCVALALLACMLAACIGERGGAAGQRPYTAVARFIPGAEVTVIQVAVSDRRALRAAELVGPAGAVIAADSVDAGTVADYQQPFSRQSVGAGFDSSGAAGVALPPGGFGGFAPPGSQTLSGGQIRSTAEIRLTDPDSYVRDWRLWQVRLRIGDPPNATILSLPAPQPPPAL
jgi:hypothetical protein